MTNTSNIQRQVMAAVALVYAARVAKSPTALKVYVVLISIGVLARLVWVAKVFQNFALVERHGLGATSNYVLFAVGHTQLAVQLTLLVAAIAFMGLILDTARTLSTRRTAFA